MVQASAVFVGRLPPPSDTTREQSTAPAIVHAELILIHPFRVM
jgi:hypothetical protein